MKIAIAALLALAALSLDPTHEDCGEGAVWTEGYGCQDASYLASNMEDCDEDQGPDEGCPPRTCAECTTDSECDALCGVPACRFEGQAGCWMPDDLKHPTTRTWWRQ